MPKPDMPVELLRPGPLSADFMHFHQLTFLETNAQDTVPALYNAVEGSAHCGSAG